MTESSLESLKLYKKSAYYERLRYGTGELLRVNPPIYIIVRDFSFMHTGMKHLEHRVCVKFFWNRGTTILMQKLGAKGAIWFYTYDLAVKYERYINTNDLARYGTYCTIPYNYEHIEFFVPMAY